MKLLCPIAGDTLTDQKRSIDVCSEFKTFNLTDRIEKQRENAYENILRTKTDRLPRILLNYRRRI
jgi:hypothetical protein